MAADAELDTNRRLYCARGSSDRRVFGSPLQGGKSGILRRHDAAGRLPGGAAQTLLPNPTVRHTPTARDAFGRMGSAQPRLPQCPERGVFLQLPHCLADLLCCLFATAGVQTLVSIPDGPVLFDSDDSAREHRIPQPLAHGSRAGAAPQSAGRQNKRARQSSGKLVREYPGGSSVISPQKKTTLPAAGGPCAASRCGKTFPSAGRGVHRYARQRSPAGSG